MTSPPPFLQQYGYPPKRKSVGVIVGSIVACLTLAVSLVVYSIFAILKGSDATQLAVRTAQADPAITQTIGAPLTVGRWVMGNINETNGSGAAKLEIPVTGPHGNGTLNVDEDRRAGVWQIQTLDFGTDGKPIQRIIPAPPKP